MLTDETVIDVGLTYGMWKELREAMRQRAQSLADFPTQRKRYALLDLFEASLDEALEDRSNRD